MRKILVVALVVAAGATLWFLVLRDDGPEPVGAGTVVEISAEPEVCWEALLDDGADPLAEPRREADCGSRQYPMSAGPRRTVLVSKTGEAGTLTVRVTVDGEEAAQGSTSEPRGTVTLEP